MLAETLKLAGEDARPAIGASFVALEKANQLARPRKHGLCLVGREDGVSAGLTPNQSIDVVTRGQVGTPWVGPVVVVATTERCVDAEDTTLHGFGNILRDVTMGDLRDVVDWFLLGPGAMAQS